MSKIELVGVVDDKIYIEIANAKIGALGIDANSIAQQLQAQNAIAPSGCVQTKDNAIALRVSGNFDSVKSVRESAARGAELGRSPIRLGDIASVIAATPTRRRRPSALVASQALRLGVDEERWRRAAKSGDSLTREMERIRGDLPVGTNFIR